MPAIDTSISTPKPNVFKTSFMDACNEDGSIEAYCLCTYNYLDARMTIDEMVRASKLIGEGGEFPLLDTAVEYCIDTIYE